MANYTIELKDVVSRYNIFGFKYDFYDEKKRKEFEEKFIRHFYFREICCPTIDRFLWYMEDKFHTVFPYYNELFKTAAIEYSVLDNYNVTETFKLTREKEGKSASVSSTIGQVFDNQSSNVDEERKSEGNREDKTDQTITTEDTVHDTGGNDTAVKGTKTLEKVGHETLTKSLDESTHEKFLDTPQGMIDVSDSKYMTTLKHIPHNLESVDENTREGTDTETTNTNTAFTQNATSEKNGKSVGNVAANGKTSEESTGKTATEFEGEQRSTHDNNSRMRTKNNTSENYELHKVGNIGVDTDADMIQKHINLQKILTRIEQMFFDECEDLFMLVY